MLACIHAALLALALRYWPCLPTLNTAAIHTKQIYEFAVQARSFLQAVARNPSTPGADFFYPRAAAKALSKIKAGVMCIGIPETGDFLATYSTSPQHEVSCLTALCNKQAGACKSKYILTDIQQREPVRFCKDLQSVLYGGSEF